MRLSGFYVGRAQRVAALLLLVLFGECLWTISHEPLDANDYRYAQCGREMWERPSVLQGYFTTCGNLNGDGTLAYRLAGFPLTVQRIALLSVDHFRKPENRVYANGSLNGSTWEARHELGFVKYLLRIPFVLFAIWLGGGLWWVSKRLFGPEGGALSLALYVFCPAIVQYATHPNNEILAMWGLYGMIYAAMGVAHTLQGPRAKWKPRIVLLTVALGLTATAHLLAAMAGFLAGAAFFFYLAERRRAYVSQIMIYAALGAMVIVFAGFSFRPSAFLYVFTGGSARFWFTLDAVRRFATTPANAGILVAALVAAVIYATSRPSRYFGNTAPLLMLLALFPLYTTQVVSAPWLWALPFLFTFVGGVFADALESRQRTVFVLLTVGVVVTQAALCWVTLAGLLG
jgi:multisubunit Na+/H+ antiporter MnhE subunit